MRKILFLILILSIILSMSNCKEDKEDGNNSTYKESPKNVTIIFSTDGGNSISNKTTPYDSKLDSIEAEKEGYSFRGWFLDEDFNSPFDFEKPISRQITYQENITFI